MDRIDLNVVMQNVKQEDKSGISSKEMHKMVIQAHIFRKKRGQKEPNANLSDRDMEKFCIMDDEATFMLQAAVSRFFLSFRSIKKVQKVARTIADLQACEVINKEHLLEALSYRRR